MLNDARAASACSYVMSKSQKQQKIATIRDFHVYICVNLTNESHVHNIQFWLFNISYLSISNATFRSQPHLNQTSGCTDMNNSWSLKQRKT